MSVKDILLHLRFPFSFFLMPIFWLALSQQNEGDWWLNLLIFVILHLLVYPASNAYNSYFDKDETSIGGLKNPPKVDRSLWKTANYFDALAILFSFFLVNRFFGILVILYIFVSRMYSWPGVRLKKYAFLSWAIVGLFQGALVYIMVYLGGQNLNWENLPTFFDSTNGSAYLGALMSSTILWAIYPITQVYQHDSDKKNGDITASIKLGIYGTFLAASLFFSISLGIAFLFLPFNFFLRFLFFSLPISIFLGLWILKIRKNKNEVNFKNTMILNTLSSILLNLCFASFYF
jgi:4-hydroxybenzoate polyprenyltransferase